MARALIVGCGCRGRELGAALAQRGWLVRGTSREPASLAAIEAAGIEAVVADLSTEVTEASAGGAGRRTAGGDVAALLASLDLGEDGGATVGNRIRCEQKVSARTRIEVVTEGILTRMLQDDPELGGSGPGGVGVVMSRTSVNRSPRVYGHSGRHQQSHFEIG